LAEHPSVWGRLKALVHGELPTDTLEAYRRAGLAVDELLKDVEDKRLDLKIQGIDPWHVDPATQVEFLCAWNAFALQSLGDAFLDADYRADPATVGFLPPITAAQVDALYGHVEEWLSRANQARCNPGYQLDLRVPADLPAWAEVEPCPRQHLEAMLAATDVLRTHAESAMALFDTAHAPADKQGTIHYLHQLLADASTKVDYARRLQGGYVSEELHEQIQRQLEGALEGYYHVGQLLAMPPLADAWRRTARAPATAVARASRLPAPGEPGFDPWCLTDPAARFLLRRDRQAREAIEALWRVDPDPKRTLAIHSGIATALKLRQIAYATTRTGKRLGYYYRCPWSAVYVARRPVTIGGKQLGKDDQFTFDVSAEGMLQGKSFRRKILVAGFDPTSEMDYFDPSREGQSD
jgi:hypothetical protein